MKKKDILIGIGFICLGILIDQLLKIIVRINLEENNSVTFIKHFIDFTHCENTGAAWSFLNDNTIILTLISIVILGFFIYMYRKINFKENMLFSISLVLVISGTIGNLIDRIAFQSVTDFLDVEIFGWTGFPVFNFADILLVVGFALFIIYLIFFDESEDKPKRRFTSGEKIEDDEEDEVEAINNTEENETNALDDEAINNDGDSDEGTIRNN